MKLKHLSAAAVAVLSLAASAQTKPPSDIKIALILDKGGKDDKSFNASAFQGASKAKDQLKIQLKVVEATDDNAFEPLLRSFAQKDFDLIIAIGVSQQEAVKKVAPQFPNLKFAIVDAEVKAPNVRSILFQEHEGSYLVGAVAALTSKANTFGFIGGMDIPLIRRFGMGYEAGIKKVKPGAKVISNYIGVTADAWNNPAKAKELARSQYSSGADTVFAAAGASNAGLFDAAEEKKAFAIGVDSNQNWIKPGRVLTSMLKRVDIGVFMTIMDLVGGAFSPGLKRYGLANQGVDYAMDEHNAKLVPEDVRKKVNAIKADIVAGKIIVPDYYNKK